MVSPLRFDDRGLTLLDQTRLPSEEMWIDCPDVEAVAAAIRRLAVRGAPAIGIAAAYGLALAMRPGYRDRPGRRFAEAFELLAATRPTAVNLRWALERGRAAFERAAPAGPQAIFDGLVAAARTIEREQLDADARIAAAGAALFASGDRVLTHCNAGALATGGSGTAGGVLAAAWRAGRLAAVWVDETRPLLQGARLTAWELARDEIPFTIVTDSSVGLLMSRGLVDRVVVGADRIAANGDVANKIGTYTVAAMAARHDVPFLVAAPLSTIDSGTATGAEIPIEQREPREVTAVGGQVVAPPGAAAANWAFDVTPAELVAAIITEAGVLRAPFTKSIAGALRDATAPDGGRPSQCRR